MLPILSGPWCKQLVKIRDLGYGRSGSHLVQGKVSEAVMMVRENSQSHSRGWGPYLIVLPFSQFPVRQQGLHPFWSWYSLAMQFKLLNIVSSPAPTCCCIFKFPTTSTPMKCVVKWTCFIFLIHSSQWFPVDALRRKARVWHPSHSPIEIWVLQLKKKSFKWLGNIWRGLIKVRGQLPLPTSNTKMLPQLVKRGT